MNRAYYQSTISDFITEDSNSILGQLSRNHTNRHLEDLQKNAWVQQIEILKNELKAFEGKIYFEFSIPRMGKRVDNIIIIQDCIFVVEFKVGDSKFGKHAELQVIDYSLDLLHFHEGSHNAKLIPVLVATKAKPQPFYIDEVIELNQVAKCNKLTIKDTLSKFIRGNDKKIDTYKWENSNYKPTPTIIEFAQALYKGHNVKEISRHDSEKINLTKTSDCINRVIDDSKANRKKSICFITGVPGAGKTLAGLNIANERMIADKDEHAVFLSGNGPLVDVLREALAIDLYNSSKEKGESLAKGEARRRTNTFIQNIHHFRDEYFKKQICSNRKGSCI